MMSEAFQLSESVHNLPGILVPHFNCLSIYYFYQIVMQKFELLATASLLQITTVPIYLEFILADFFGFLSQTGGTTSKSKNLPDTIEEVLR